MTRTEEHVAFYYELGLAISVWASVEQRLCDIVQVCLNNTDHVSVIVSFYAIENFRSKLQYADALVRAQHWQNQPVMDKWAIMVESARKASTKRNHLAHRHAVEFGDPKASPGRRFALLDWAKWWSDAPPSSKPPSGSLCVRDISIIQSEFLKLQHELNDLAWQMRGVQLPLRGSRARVPDPPTIRMLRDYLRAALAPPPKSSRE